MADKGDSFTGGEPWEVEIADAITWLSKHKRYFTGVTEGMTVMKPVKTYVNARKVAVKAHTHLLLSHKTAQTQMN